MPVTPTYRGSTSRRSSATRTRSPRRPHRSPSSSVTPTRSRPGRRTRRGRRDLLVHRLRTRVRRPVQRRLARTDVRWPCSSSSATAARSRMSWHFQPQFHLFGGGTALPQPQILAPTLTLGEATAGVVFSGREPVDAHHQLTVSVTNLRPTIPPPPGQPPGPLDVADLTITYGDRRETFRRVTLNALASGSERRQHPGATHRDRSPARFLSGNGSASGNDSRADGTYPTVSAGGARAHSAEWRAACGAVHDLSPRRLRRRLRAGQGSGQDPRVQSPAHAGDLDPPVASEALAMAERKRAFVVADPLADASPTRPARRCR